MSRDKDIDFLRVHVLGTLRNLKLRSRTKFKSYFKNRTTIIPLIKQRENEQLKYHRNVLHTYKM